jgi:hypothetical protein
MNNQAAASIPPWLRDDGLEDRNTLNNQQNLSYPSGYAQVPTGHTSSVSPSSSLDQRAKYIHWGLKITTMVLCLLMSATAVIGLGKCLSSFLQTED